MDENIEKYFNSLSEIEKQAFLIAKQQLQSSFIVELTHGYIEFMKKQNKKD